MPSTTSTQETSSELPPSEVLHRLAISQSGFVFDPVSGRSFSVNETGLAILRLLQREPRLDTLLDRLAGDFDVDRRRAERDVLEFLGSLREQLHAL